jgi:CHAT domain-containing protein
LLGQALAAIGSNMTFSKDYESMQGALKESADTLTRIGASQYASRPLYYTALWQYIAGDAEGALETALRSHRVSRPDDHIRLTQLYWLMGMTLYRANYPTHAVAFIKEAAAEASAAGNPTLIAASTTDLASIHMSMLNYAEARRHLSQATELSKDLDPRARDTVDYALNLLCGRSQLANGNPREAANCLERNMEKVKALPQQLHWYAIPTMQLLAQAQTALGKSSEARDLYERAATAADNDDSYLTTEKPRLGFDNVRRDLYEAAIAFEYDNNGANGDGGEDEAWRYVQRYRSKLFLEFLGQVNPAVARIRNEAVQRDRVQKLLGSNVQVVEYFMLKDRLLIWLVSHDRIRAFPIAVRRESLDRKITELVARIRKQEDVEQRLEEFYGLLIGPISPFLDPRRALAIIPDQALHRLPMAALRPSASSKYLGEQYAILESPNLTTLLAATNVTPERNFAVAFGSQAVDIAVEKDTSLFSRIYKRSSGVNGVSATKDNFFSFMGSASVFHYAGHSVDAPDPLRSAVLLDGDRVGPNSINALEISRRRMRPDSLVILASCDSSVGNARDGIGMRGLTSAFLIAGAGAVAGSLWPVDDVSSAGLMRAFHEEFAAKTSAAEAMRLAQVSFIARNPDHAHPYYWSGFVVNGNLSALR